MIRALGKTNVFKDSYNIPHGADFRGVIKANVARCNVVLVIIGPTWLDVTEKDNPSMRRLDNPNDWVRFEVETGLQTPATTVLPVLVQNASMPPEGKLPTTLRELAFKNAITVRDDPDFDTDMERLIKSLRGRSLPTGWLTIAAIVVLLAIVGAFLLSNRANNTSATDIEFTVTPSPTLTDTRSPTPTPTSTNTPSATPTPTDTPSATPSQTPKPTNTPSATPTETPTNTPVISCPNSPPSRLVRGEKGVVTEGEPNNIRVKPQSPKILGEIQPGETFDIIGGPVCGSDTGLTWWQVEYKEIVGWTAEGRGLDYWLAPADE